MKKLKLLFTTICLFWMAILNAMEEGDNQKASFKITINKNNDSASNLYEQNISTNEVVSKDNIDYKKLKLLVPMIEKAKQINKAKNNNFQEIIKTLEKNSQKMTFLESNLEKIKNFQEIGSIIDLQKFNELFKEFKEKSNSIDDYSSVEDFKNLIDPLIEFEKETKEKQIKSILKPLVQFDRKNTNEKFLDRILSSTKNTSSYVKKMIKGNVSKTLQFFHPTSQIAMGMLSVYTGYLFNNKGESDNSKISYIPNNIFSWGLESDGIKLIICGAGGLSHFCNFKKLSGFFSVLNTIISNPTAIISDSLYLSFIDDYSNQSWKEAFNI
jgi:hypothetical protein